MIGIYKIVNKHNGYTYVGQSIDIDRRLREHRQFFNRPAPQGSRIYRAFHKYGEDSFLFEIIEETSVEELNDRETKWISFYTKQGLSYNIHKECNQHYQPSGNSRNGLYLSGEDIVEIGTQLRDTEYTMTEIADNFNVDQSLISRINSGELWDRFDFTYPIRAYKVADIGSVSRVCNSCFTKVSKHSIKCAYCHNEAIKKLNRAYRPSKEELYLILTEKTFTDAGKSFGVSCNTIRKWCVDYGIPQHASYYKNIKQNKRNTTKGLTNT